MVDTIDQKKIFFASKVALVATAMTFAIRANLLTPIGKEFNISLVQMGIVSGTAFWGFTLSMIVGGIFCDMIGMKRLLIFAFFGHLGGIILTIFATDFWTLFISTLLVGIANGLVEAACNPLVATLYPLQKTEKLNRFHVWFPGGIVIGGLVGFCFDYFHSPWQWQVASILVPVVMYGILFFGNSFPVTERVSSGISTNAMFKACLQPLFLFMVICMLLTSATELGTNQWIVDLLKDTKVDSILLLVFINGLMVLGRSFAGPIEHKLSLPGMLLFSSFFSAVGLIILGNVSGLWSFGAAAIFAIGICFFWPTMLGFVSQYLPETGALGLSIMGGAGMLSVAIILPYIGNLFDVQTQVNLPHGETIQSLANMTDTYHKELLNLARLKGGAATLRTVAIIPSILFILFSILYIFRKKIITINYK